MRIFVIRCLGGVTIRRLFEKRMCIVRVLISNQEEQRV